MKITAKKFKKLPKSLKIILIKLELVLPLQTLRQTLSPTKGSYLLSLFICKNNY